MSDLMEKLKIEWKVEGADENQKRMVKLFAFLLKDNRIADMTRCTTDPEYLKKLLDELNQDE